MKGLSSLRTGWICRVVWEARNEETRRRDRRGGYSQKKWAIVQFGLQRLDGPACAGGGQSIIGETIYLGGEDASKVRMCAAAQVLSHAGWIGGAANAGAGYP